MRRLSAADMLQIWEIGQRQHPIDRALTLLSFALPNQPMETLVRLTIGQRDAYLLTLREITLGSKLEGFAACPHCQERLEFTLNVGDIRVVEPIPTIAPEQSLRLDDLELRFSLPNSQDLSAILGCSDLDTARHLLAQRCIHQVSRDGVLMEKTEVSAAVLSEVSDRMAAADPQAEVLLDLTCPACQHTWQILFDIVTFFWAELGVQAKRLLQEVHTLARFYGWREADILSMSTLRRQSYLDMVI
jgi:T4 bacteriophage base plate protein